MTDEQFKVYYARYRGVIASIARKLARRDEELYQDLKQEGLFALFRLNLAKVRVNEDAWIRQAVKFRMVDFLRKMNPRMYESLQAHLENGSQIVEDPDEGELHLVRPPAHRPPRAGSEYLHDAPSRFIKMLEDPAPDDDPEP